MTTILTIACILLTLFTLMRLSIIDLKVRLLPNTYVATFFLCGIFFHVLTKSSFTLPLSSFAGMIAGGGLLLIVRAIANRIYKKDTLGLGDVKLMGAGGVWLGIEDIFLAISIGAFIGLLHGLIYKIHHTRKTGKTIDLSTLSIPAGPGFIAGILIVGIIKFQTLPQLLKLL